MEEWLRRETKRMGCGEREREEGEDGVQMAN